MSKKNKVIKLASKNRDRGKSFYVTYNGVEMTRAEREALIRASQAKAAPEPAPSGKKAKKGTKIAEPSHSKLFNLLRPKKKQTVAPDLKSVEYKAPEKEEPKKEEPKKEEPKKVEKPAPAPEPVKEEPKPAPAKKPEPVKPAPVDDDDDDDEEIEDDGEEDDLTQAISKKNAKKRISPNFVKRVGKTAGQSCDECLRIQHTFDEKIAEIDAQIKAAKTPKDASDEVRAEFNDKRKALRAQKKQLELERDTNASKAVAFERACDGYCDIYTLLTGKELEVRKTERINPFIPLTEEMELEVLNSLWADKNARRAPKKKS